MSAKKILVGVCGSIAAYKSVELVRELQRQGHQVRVMMSARAAEFVGPLTFSGITGYEVVQDMWAWPQGEIHVELARWADAVVLAPITANTLAKCAQGLADDVLCATFLCAQSPVWMAPAMHSRMWKHPSTQKNIAALTQMGVRWLGPVEGALANGDVGVGRLLEPVEMAQRIDAELKASQDLKGRTLIITAGPTVEDIDPVRFISNRSSGKMGYALAQCALRRGAQVTLISGPSAETAPREARLVRVRTALEMRKKIREELRKKTDVLIMAAAVSDYRALQTSSKKIKRSASSLSLELTANPDILAELGQKRRGSKPLLIGFALETDQVLARARQKLLTKKADLIVANHASMALEKDTNQATLVHRKGSQKLPPMSKQALADEILNWLQKRLTRKESI